MEFYYDILKETKDEISKMSFFKDGVKIDETEYEVIHDFEEAYNNAFENFFEYGEFEGQTWVDILEENVAEVWNVIYQQKNYAELSKVVSAVEVAGNMEIEYNIEDENVIMEIEAELDLCAQSRFVCGKENLFFESLFRAYSLGGWPCGWRNGKIIVYVKQ